MAIESPRETEALVRDTFRRLFDERDLAGVAERMWTADTVNHFLALDLSVRGPEALMRFFAELFAALPDWTLEIEHVFAHDRHAVVQWHGAGTHTGSPWQGIEPTGRRVDLRGCDVFRLDADGRIQENTIYYDGATFARQIGMLPSTGSRADRAVLSAFNAAVKARRRVAAR